MLLVLQLFTYGVLILSILGWQRDIVHHQFLLELLVISIIGVFAFQAVLNNKRQPRLPVVFSLQGDWLETHTDGHIGWIITSSSRVSHFVLFVHLISPVNAGRSKWCLIYKDQVTERDFRRICCAIIYKQESMEKN